MSVNFNKLLSNLYQKEQKLRKDLNLIEKEIAQTSAMLAEEKAEHRNFIKSLKQDDYVVVITNGKPCVRRVYNVHPPYEHVAIYSKGADSLTTNNNTYTVKASCVYSLEDFVENGMKLCKPDSNWYSLYSKVNAYIRDKDKHEISNQ